MKRLIRLIALLSVSILPGMPAHVMAADWRGWRAFYTVEGVANAAMLAQDTQGNTYVGGTVWEGDPGWGVGVVKYDRDGHRLWAYVFDPDSPSDPRADDAFSGFVVDAQQNVYVTAAHFAPLSSVEVFKLDRDGHLLWQQSGEEYSSYASELAVDAAGNCFIAGTIGAGFSPQSFLSKYSSAGEKLWERRYGAQIWPYWGSAQSLALDPAGNIFVVGFQFTISKFDTDGNELWQKNYDGQSATKVLTDDLGNAYVTGTRLEADAFTVKLDPAGQELWQNIYAEPGARWTSPTDLILDPHGNAYFAAFTDNNLRPIVKLDPEGRVVWHKREWAGQDLALVGRLAVDQNERVWMQYTAVARRNSTDGVLVSFGPDGQRLSRTHLRTGRDAQEIGGDILLDQQGRPVVTFFGQSNGVSGWVTAKLPWTRSSRPFWPPHKHSW